MIMTDIRDWVGWDGMGWDGFGLDMRGREGSFIVTPFPLGLNLLFFSRRISDLSGWLFAFLAYFLWPLDDT